MHSFRYVGNKLFCEGVSVESLVKQFGTPLFIYSQATLTDHFKKLDNAMDGVDHLVCYAMKSNSNLAVLRTIADLGGGFDIVSAGELQRIIAAGGDPKNCVFAGVGKTEAEIEFALRKGVYSFNVESEPELQRINRVAARLKKIAPIAVRVNPNVDAGTHAKITTGTYENKFGIAFEKVEGVYARASKLKNLKLRGVQMHIGSQLTDVKPFEQAARKVIPLVEKLKNRHGLEFFSIGGGIGIVYDPALESGSPEWWSAVDHPKRITPEAYAAAIVPILKPLGLRILFEPGRFMVGNAGALLSTVQYVKKTPSKTFTVVDAAMNDLIRPALYEGYHEIQPLRASKEAAVVMSVVGPVCESGDFFAQDREIAPREQDDRIALLSAGAYGFVMSSNYNSRPLLPEVLVDGATSHVIRKRQTLEDLIQGESIP